MDMSGHRPWALAALLVGVVYFLVGRLFAVPTDHVQAWRLAAWVVSFMAYAAHIGYELFTARRSPLPAALHAAAAVAIGAFALAAAGAVHSLSSASTLKPLWLLALVLWPAATAVPAFLAALVAGAMLVRFRRSA